MTRGRREEDGSARRLRSRLFRQDENVGSSTLTAREAEELDSGRAAGREGKGPRAVIYEVSKTLYTPTRQRAGLAPRNPVLALTHRYLSHDHFRPIRARAHAAYTYIYTHARAHTYTHGVLSSLPPHAGVFTIYSAPRVGNAVGYLVDIVYLGYNPPHDPRDFSSTTAAYRIYIYIYTPPRRP